MKTLTRILLCLAVLTLACGTLFAADDQRVPDSLTTIYSNLGSKTDAYDDLALWGVFSPTSSNVEQWVAMPFTPKANATVTQIQIAATAPDPNTIGFTLVLAADSAGLPGKSLHSWQLPILPLWQTCCQLVTLNYAKGIEVEAGKQYWVVGKSATGAGGFWQQTWNHIAGNFAANLFNLGWMPEHGYLGAFAVRGK